MVVERSPLQESFHRLEARSKSAQSQELSLSMLDAVGPFYEDQIGHRQTVEPNFRRESLSNQIQVKFIAGVERINQANGPTVD